MSDKTQQDYTKDLEAQVTNLRRLLEVNSVLNTALLSQDAHLDSLLSYLMNAAAEITASQAASVLLWDENTHDLYFAATTTDTTSSHALIGKPVPLDSIAGRVLNKRQIVTVDDVSAEPDHYNKVDEDIEFETKSLIGVPMISKNRAIGVLEVVNKRDGSWTMDDRNNLSMLAGEVAVAIEVAQLVRDLQKANNELSELDKLKNDFIGIASHELRTPLGIIMGYASFLQDSDDDSVNTHAAKVMASAMQLRDIIEGMINLRYLKQKPGDLRREHLRFKTLLEDLERDILTQMDTTNHELKIECDDKGQHVYVDRSRVSMALMNVLNNAANFSPDGTPIVVTGKIVNGREAWIAVTDQGLGLEQDQLDRIFTEFYQVEDHMTRRQGGLGLGLSIAQALVEAHEGRIWATSEGLGKGTTFTISLPLAEQVVHKD